ncbi:hypothetical protein LTS18_002337, partial [Coniosporium uncinatum]
MEETYWHSALSEPDYYHPSHGPFKKRSFDGRTVLSSANQTNVSESDCYLPQFRLPHTTLIEHSKGKSAHGSIDEVMNGNTDAAQDAS